MTFKDLISEPKILQAVEESGFTAPTAIQQQAIPLILKGVDLRASAQTGTGKTAAFILPTLCRLGTKPALPGHGPRVLVLVPTRELAMQVAQEASKYSRHLSRVKTVCIYGGVPYFKQLKDLSRPYEILVATPGRLIDFMERSKVHFSRLEMLILDEADRMLDMGFIDPVEQIAAATPKQRQTLMFSATLKGAVLKLSQRLLNNPMEVTVSAQHAKHEHIEQRLHRVDNIGHKYRLLNHLINDPAVKQAIIFTSTKRQADELVDKLNELGYRAAAMHGDMNQKQRTRTIHQLRQGQIRILVATDVAARGIDVHTITHVINFDLPHNAEDYVHRIGRTGRAGAYGIALSFASPKESHLIREIEKFTGHPMVSHTIAGLEPQLKANYQPAKATFRPKNRFRSQRFKTNSFRSKR